MSFKIDWNFVDPDSLKSKARDVFRQAMNKGIKPEVIVGDIELASLDLGSKAPRLKVLEIGELDLDKFRGIFKLEYDGDAHFSLRTKIEANQLALMNKNNNENSDSISPAAKAFGLGPTNIDLGRSGIIPKMNLASKSLRLPLSIYLSEMRLSAIVIVVFSLAKGLTLVFQNDPLQSVKIQSSFDFVPGVAEFIQKEIEERLTESFRDDIPEILYQLSQNNESFSQALSQVKHDHSHAQDTSKIPDGGQHATEEDEDQATSSAFENNHSPSHSSRSRRAELSGFGFQDTMRLDTPTVKEAVSRATLGLFEQQQLKRFKALNSHSSQYRFDKTHKPRRRVVKLGAPKADSKTSAKPIPNNGPVPRGISHGLTEWIDPPPTYREVPAKYS